MSALSKLFTFNIGAIHSSLLKLLDNPLYAGLIWLPAFEGKPEWYIKALHEAIIPESIFWLAHEIIKGRSGNRARPKADFTLRGIMRCECGTHLTAGFSEGKKKYYMHYQCTKGKGRNLRCCWENQARRATSGSVSARKQIFLLSSSAAREILEAVGVRKPTPS